MADAGDDGIATTLIDTFPSASPVGMGCCGVVANRGEEEDEAKADDITRLDRPRALEVHPRDGRRWVRPAAGIGSGVGSAEGK